MATAKQIKLIHCLKSALCLDDGTYRAMLAGYGVESSKDLRDSQAELLKHDLETKAIAVGVWKKRSAPIGKGRRPHNLGAGRSSREEQLRKIEALLTVGGKGWEYADALALRICKVASLVWVPAEDLYKIITALRKQAQREGWDLSGEVGR
jgi:phage gp16-like protein